MPQALSVVPIGYPVFTQKQVMGSHKNKRRDQQQHQRDDQFPQRYNISVKAFHFKLHFLAPLYVVSQSPHIHTRPETRAEE